MNHLVHFLDSTQTVFQRQLRPAAQLLPARAFKAGYALIEAPSLIHRRPTFCAKRSGFTIITDFFLYLHASDLTTRK